MTNKPGWVYFGDSTRKDGTKKTYTGITRRPLSKRWGEHISSQFSKDKKTWVSKGKYFKPLGGLWSNNPEKAERTIKRLDNYSKRALAKKGAINYYKRKF